MNKQQVIDVINKEFKGKAYDFGCFYLTKDGRKCAIGMFIPDGHPGQRDQCGVGYLLDKHSDLKSFMPSDDEELLRQFQRAHDCLLSVADPIDQQRQTLINWVHKNWSLTE